MHRILLRNFCQTLRLIMFIKIWWYKKFHRAVIELWAPNAVIKGVVAGHTVAMVTYCDTKMTCSPMIGEQGWRSDDRARLPPMWPGVDSRTRCHKWVEFVVGSRPCSEGFSPGSPVFLPPQKSTYLNSNSIGNSRARGLSVVWLLCVTLVETKLILFIWFIGQCFYTIILAPSDKDWL